MKNQLVKTIFGVVIFLFSTALAYFTANLLSNNGSFDYWGAIAVFSCAYVVMGVLVSMIFPLSLGFLFSADVLILHLLFEYYGAWANELKLVVIGMILVIVYLCALFWMEDVPEISPAPLSQTPHIG